MPEVDGAASVTTEALAPAPVARKLVRPTPRCDAPCVMTPFRASDSGAFCALTQAPLLPPARKQFTAPSSAKPAAAESAAGAGAETAEKAKAPRLKTAYVRVPMHHVSRVAFQ